ncbi:MAG: response regulator transcription factor, partial [Actinobacteria bacterium]|nr:response regulator transcription factor [Actinomycetota bacterium]
MRVLLVDDHPSLRLGVKVLLTGTHDLEVVGEAKDAQVAVKLTSELEPDLVILDLRLRGEKGGITACQEIKALPEAPRVLIYTAYSSAEDLSAAALAGADGYLCKGIEGPSLVDVIRRTCAGERVWVI